MGMTHLKIGLSLSTVWKSVSTRCIFKQSKGIVIECGKSSSVWLERENCRFLCYRLSTKSFPDYRHLLQKTTVRGIQTFFFYKMSLKFFLQHISICAKS